MVAASSAVNAPTNATVIIAASLPTNSVPHRAIMYTPAVTIVAAWISALTGVGPSIASGSHVCSGICADFATAPPSRPSAISVIAVHVPDRVRDDQEADPGDDEHHEDRQGIDEDREAEVEPAGAEPGPERRSVRALLCGLVDQPEERDQRCDEGDEHRERRQVSGGAPGDPRAGEGGQRCRAERREQAD